MKKFINILSLICYLSITSLASALTASVPSLTAMPDTTVSVPISVDDVAGVTGGLLVLRFDATLLRAQSVQRGDLIAGFSFVMNILNDEVRISFARSRGLAGGSGAIATITFAISPQAANGSRSELTLAQAEFYDETAQAINVTLTGGQIGIESENQFEMLIPAGISMIHIPLEVAVVNDQPTPMRTVGDFYDALGGAANVNLMLTYQRTERRWLTYLGETSRNTPADAAIQPDTGLIALMKNAVRLNLRGKPWGTEGRSRITLTAGINLIGMPLRDASITRVTDLLNREGLKGNITSIIVYDGGAFRVVTRPDDVGDIVITGEGAFILTARAPAEIPITGEGWGK
jgi:hypothetical protein